jgi:hypothetical protein
LQGNGYIARGFTRSFGDHQGNAGGVVPVIFLSRALNLDVQGGINNLRWQFVGGYGVSNGKQDRIG